MNSSRFPVAVTVSLGLHAGLVWLFLAVHKAAQRAPKTISNVDLLVQAPNSAARAPHPAARTVKPTTWNFLKLALPALPKVRPEALQVKMPELHHELMPMEPKLDDRGRRVSQMQMKALDLNRARTPDEAQMIHENISFRHESAALSQMPKLEEVGVRRAKFVPPALNLEAERQAPQALQAMNVNVEPAEQREVPQVQALQEAAPAAKPSWSQRLANFLPSEGERLSLKPQEAPAAAPDLSALSAPAPRKRAIVPEEMKKQGVQIEGPLSNRKVTAYSVPSFPAWAKNEGILEASVVIRFWVSPQGDVLADEMRIERTSGYGRLDRLAMEALKKWRFAPISSDEKQWGLITFQFELE